MSIFTVIAAKVEALWDELKGSKAATIVDNLYNEVVAELESIGPEAVEQAVETIGVAVLGGMSGGIDAAIAAGVAAAPAAFEAAGKEVSTATVQVLTTGIAQQLQAQVASGATTVPGSGS